jgi:hypothetical protein
MVAAFPAWAGKDADFVAALDMLAELRDDNNQLAANARETDDLCDEHGDVATARLLENWVDEASGASSCSRPLVQAKLVDRLTAPRGN